MKLVRSWNDLEPFGIVPLTGESCGLAWRLLCDVTARGRQIVRACFGVPALELAEPWNRGAEEDPHVGSLLLVPDMFLPLAVFALLENGCRECWLHEHGQLFGVEPGDAPEHVALHRTMYEGQLKRVFAYRGTAGNRNAHQMSGRIV